jgi:diacylglycerol kinase (ATP)
MRAAATFGLNSSPRDLKPFQDISQAVWTIGLPAAANEADVILVFGGDGTVHRHLADLVKLGLPVLVVPLGSGNDFARALNLCSARNSLAAFERFAAGACNVRRVDIGVVTTSCSSPRLRHYFCCVAGCGLDAEVARRANQLPAWLRSHGGYAICLAAALRRFAAPRTEIRLPKSEGSQEFDTSGSNLTALIACANTATYGGGMRIAPRAAMDDGKLDICLVGDLGRLKLFGLFPSVYFGRHLSLAGVEYFQAERLRIETEQPVDIYADGEYVCKTPVEIGIEPTALTVVVP